MPENRTEPLDYLIDNEYCTLHTAVPFQTGATDTKV